MSEKTCATCYHALDFMKQFCVCKTCNDHEHWKPVEEGRVVPSHHIDPGLILIIEPAYRELVKMYDRYMEISLMIPLTDQLIKRIADMEEFFNRMLVLGMIEYEKQLEPIEKSFGIKK